jgi:hypothetical protein
MGARMPSAINAAVHFLVIVRTGESCYEHAHSYEDRANERDDEKEDLKGGPDRRIGLIADQVPDHYLIHPSLQSAEEIGQDSRPRDLPHGASERALNDRTVEFLFGFTGRHGIGFIG